ncbi:MULTISPECIES: nutrient deprivation-induced protein [unclassified Sinorhizobium]|uniref:nutrient deprivation-induced protein n=1 Tax=unclassified Sinorhizobium TaxID=2613772 RepID=UPI0024C2C6F0|nr:MULTISPECIES: nutrient deprivation-induced protein [unclassified Sinorhizobium]MDK1377356.1 nutrient deprivation-induced protein [Sinorhizobium sp. 6-70]MDK1478846.1 nutrient deprivation-induced protein [Sinorhizobium sp. 6-117]
MNNEPSGRASGDPLRVPATTPQGVDDAHGAQSSGIEEGATDRNLQQAVREDLNDVRKFADEQAEQAREAASRAAEREKNVAARQLSGVAMALEKVGSELQQSDQQALGRYAQQIGTSLHGLARDIEGRDLGEVAGMAEDFGRKQPLAFLGIAAIAGLAASRFLTASAQRRPRRTVSQPSSAAEPESGRPNAGGWNFEEEQYNG